MTMEPEARRVVNDQGVSDSAISFLPLICTSTSTAKQSQYRSSLGLRGLLGSLFLTSHNIRVEDLEPFTTKQQGSRRQDLGGRHQQLEELDFRNTLRDAYLWETSLQQAWTFSVVSSTRPTRDW
jgi:hypothetical protein